MTSSLGHKLAAHWRIKAITGGIITCAFWLGYFTLGRISLFPTTVLPQTRLDAMVPFAPEAALVYLSQFVTMPLLTWLMTSRKDLLAYCKATVAVFACCFLIFLLWPTSVVRPQWPSTDPSLYGLIVRYDTPQNAFPSLHAAFGILIAGCACDMIRSWRGRRFLTFLVWGWTAAILLSTLLTKQHVLADLVAGSMIGAAGVWTYGRLQRGAGGNARGVS